MMRSLLSQDGDAVAIFNFRADRVVEISKAFEYKDFDKFDRKRYPDVRARAPVMHACMLAPPMRAAFAVSSLRAALLSCVSRHVCPALQGCTQPLQDAPRGYACSRGLPAPVTRSCCSMQQGAALHVRHARHASLASSACALTGQCGCWRPCRFASRG